MGLTTTDTTAIETLNAQLERVLSERNKINTKLNSLGIKLGPQVIDSERWYASTGAGDVFNVVGYSDGKVEITLIEDPENPTQRTNTITITSLPELVRLTEVTGPDEVILRSGSNFEYSIGSIKQDYAEGLEYHEFTSYNGVLTLRFDSPDYSVSSRIVTMYIYSMIDDDLQGCREALEKVTARGYTDVTYDYMNTYIPKGYYNTDLEVDHT